MADMKKQWNEKRYHSLDYELKTVFGEKLYKISLDAGMTCPNRDGIIGTRGCIFCSQGGSGDFASDRRLSITEQIERGKAQTASKYQGSGYIAYFQAYTNTYAPPERLRAVYQEEASHPDIRVLSIATRPDCLDKEVLDILTEFNRIKPVWIELGLQTIHEKTAQLIRRGYELPVFEASVRALRLRRIPVIVHTILGLPGEDPDMFLDTVRYLNTMDIQGVKFQLLHVLKHTDLAKLYEKEPFWLPAMEEYIEIIGQALCLLRPDITVHRLTGDGPKSLLIAPEWSGNKRQVLNCLNQYLKQQDLWQGKDFHYDINI